METHTKLHSEEYFGEQRNFWWNQDFIEVMAKRWQLNQVHSLLDVGCGIGHWSRLLAPYLANEACIIGIDREQEWVKKSHDFPISRNATYQVADATHLPFPDSSFDCVTCQTVLIHLKDPEAALKEFIRVLKPGGLLAVAEPNNSASLMIRSNLDLTKSVDERLNQIRFQLMCNNGKINLGEGDDSIGDLVPGYFAQMQLTDIKVYLSDKASSLFAPYESLEQKISIEQFRDYTEREVYCWDKEDTLRYFMAGGGCEQEFEKYWIENVEEMKSFIKSIENKKYHCAGGQVFYLISGRKI